MAERGSITGITGNCVTRAPTLYLAAHPTNPPNPNLSNRDTTDVTKETLMTGKTPCNRSRIMIIGPAGVGKTSLFRRLTGQDFNPAENSTKGTEQNTVSKSAVSSWKIVGNEKDAKVEVAESIASCEHQTMKEKFKRDNEEQEVAGSLVTPVINQGSRLPGNKRKLESSKIDGLVRDISNRQVKTKSSEGGTTYSFWDFGGQEIYYITHPLFLSWRALYILVFPLHLDLCDRAPRTEDYELPGSAVRTHRTILDLIDFWLMSVYTHAVHPDEEQKYEPQVLLVGTFAKEGGTRLSEEKVASKVKVLEELINSRPYRKQVMWPIQLFDNRHARAKEVSGLQHHIDGIISTSNYMKVSFPIRWNTFLCESEDSDQNTMTVEEARSKMKSWQIDDKEEQDRILQFFHDTGHIIYHRGCELIVLKPQYLNAIIANIITVIDDELMQTSLVKHYEELKNNGILNIAIVNAVLEKTKGEHAQLDGIIDMMKKFDLICEIPGQENVERRFFVPCRSSPTLDEIQQFPRDDEIEFVIDFNHFLPDGILHRLYVRMAKWSMEREPSLIPTFHCRQMVFYIDSDHRMEMTNEIHNEEPNQIKVTIYTIVPDNEESARPKAKVSLNDDVINHLHESLEDLQRLWARGIEYSIGIPCTRCTKFGKKGIILMRRILEEKKEKGTCINLCAANVGRIVKAFNKHSEAYLRSAKDTFHDILITVARRVQQNSQIDTLGLNLRFSPEDIQNYIATNHKTQRVTYDGTLLMLRDWFRKQKPGTEREELKSALERSSEIRLAAELFPSTT